MLCKVLVMKTEEIGKAPYYAEFFTTEHILSAGIPTAGGGYHVPPKSVCRFAKKPFRSAYLSERALEFFLKKEEFKVEFI